MKPTTNTKPVSTNPVAVRNRIAKALRLANYVTNNKALFDGLKPEEIPLTSWNLVNKLLNEQKSTLSGETIAMAVAILAERKFNA